MLIYKVLINKDLSDNENNHHTGLELYAAGDKIALQINNGVHEEYKAGYKHTYLYLSDAEGEIDSLIEALNKIRNKNT